MAACTSRLWMAAPRSSHLSNWGRLFQTFAFGYHVGGTYGMCFWAQLRLPPNTPFITYMDGQLKKRAEGAGDMSYEMSPKTQIFSKAHSKKMPLDKFVKDYHATAREVWGYKAFSPGVLPKVLERTKAYTYVTGDRVSAPGVIAAAQASKSRSLRLDEVCTSDAPRCAWASFVCMCVGVDLHACERLWDICLSLFV